MKKTVLIVDDHPLIRQAIRQALAPDDFEFVGETANGAEALRMITALNPDIVVLDIGLDGMDGLSVLKRITREKIDTRVLVFTSQMKETYAARCLQTGASGFVSKSEPIRTLINAVRTVADGYVHFPKDAMPLLGSASPSGDLENLSDREMQVLRLLVQGLSNRDIASKLNLSNKTVSGHKINILNKLGVSSLVDLADIARRHNLT